MSYFPRRLRLLALAVFGAAVAALVGLALTAPAPTLLPLLLFGALVAFSEQRAVYLPTGVTVSAYFMVGMAAVVVFREQHALVGPLVVGMAAGLNVAALRNEHQRWWVPFNAGVGGLAQLAAAGAFWLVPERFSARMPVALLVAVPPAIAFVAVSFVLVLLSYVIEGSTTMREDLSGFAASVPQVLPFALMGVLLGRLYLDVGPAVVLLLVVPILVARETFASYLELKAANESTVRVLIRALEAKDRYTAGHAERVARYAQYVGEEMRFGPVRLERLRFAALMHDIGKLVVPNHLLNKPGKLTAEEFARVRMHEQVSVQMLSRIDFLAPVAPASTHEHTMYRPDEPDHPIEPYIVMVSDAFDAMTSTRSYRRALSQEVAFRELRDKAGVQFHPSCVEALIHAIEVRGEVHGEGQAEDESHWEVAPPDAGVGSAGLGDLAAPGGEPPVRDGGGQ